MGTNYTFARNKIYDVGADASAAIKEAIPGFPDATSTTYYTSSVGYSLFYDTRDNKKRPTSGVYYTVAQDLAGVGGDVRYIRSVGEARAYYAVTDDITAVGRATGGIIGGWGGQDVRLLDLFYKGSETVRGFATAGYRAARHAERQPGRAGRPDVLCHHRRGCCSRSPACRRTWACAAPCSPMPARCGGSTARRPSSPVPSAIRPRCAPPWASDSPGIRPSARCVPTTPFPVVKQPYDKTQAFSFGLMPF